MTNLNENYPIFRTSLLEFEEKILQLARDSRLNLSDYEIDHLALRVNSEQSAKNWLTLLLKYGKIVSDNFINGRPIYLIVLEHTFKFAYLLIDIM